VTQPSGRLAGRVAIITGASTGIGAGIAARFLAEGASVGLMSRRADRLAATVESLDAPDRVLAMPGDVTDRGAVQRLVDATRDRFARLDIVVSNAGIQRLGSFLAMDPDAWREIIEVNVGGTFNVCQIGARALVEQGHGGAIVVVASTNSFVAEPSMSAYNASKGSLPVLVQSMAIELARYRIRVNAVAPGTIESEMTRPMIEAGFPFGGIPLDRLGTPDDVAWPVLFLASNEAAYVTGATLVVDGGQLAINGALAPDAAPG
jgi:glucose 1-dehydrogenase